MKKQTLAIAALLLTSASFSYGQWNPGAPPTVIEANPGLHDLRFTPAMSIRSIRGEAQESYFEIYGNHDGTNGPGILLYNNNVNMSNHPFAGKGKIALMATEGTAEYNTDAALDIYHYDGGVGYSTVFRLSKDGDILLKNNSNQGNYNAIKGNSDVSGMVMYGNTSWSNGAGILLKGKSNEHGAIDFVVPEDATGPDHAYNFWTADANGDWTNNLMYITKDGQVSIGAAPLVSPYDYKLYVATGILTERLKVATVGGGQWADFVFDNSYELKSLNDVEQFITKNKHLPDVPSACEVEEKGYDVTTMDATLLQKIEELTLYIIQQQKEIDALKLKLN